MDEYDEIYIKTEENAEAISFVEKEHKGMTRVFILISFTGDENIPHSIAHWFWDNPEIVLWEAKK